MRSSVAVVAFATSLWLPSYAVRAQPYEVVIVDDLADVAGCRFLGPVRAATTEPWTPEMLQRRAYRADRMAVPVRREVSHIFISNLSAKWGGALAAGAAYGCRR